MQKKDSVSLRNRINATVRDIPRSGIRDFFDIVSTMKDVISLGIGEPDFDTPWHVRESTMFALERGVTHYTSNYGYLELRRALAKYVGKNFGAEYNPEDEILITVGVSEALDLALRALVTPGDEVLITNRATCRIAPPFCLRTGCRWRLKPNPKTASASRERCSKRR
jgi:aminotransferase